MKFRIFPEISLKPRISIILISLFFKIMAGAFSSIAWAANNQALGILGTIVWLFWFSLLFIAAIPSTDEFFSRHFSWLGKTAKVSVCTLIFIGILEIAFAISLGLGFFHSADGDSNNLVNYFERIGVYGDAAALEHQATNNFLEGENPYREANVITAATEFGVPSGKLTPLRIGQFAEDFPYPDMEKIEELYVNAQVTPDEIPLELESKFGYPAASFILPAPFIAAGINDLRIVFPLFFLPALGYAIWRIQPKMRFYFIAALLASLELWNSLSSGETGFLVFPLLLLVWLLYRRNLWLSAIFMGIAIATKQIAWFLLPFYLILILRERGLGRAASIGAIVSCIFLAFNLPYIITDPGLWLSSVVAPMTDALFPNGGGIIMFSYTGLIDAESSLPFTIMEVIVLIAALIWYFFNCRRFPETALILAVFPIFFSWRSGWTYFFYMDIIMLATIMIYEYRENWNL
ncbi:MAG TPA: hypothetical protein G4O19_02035 [Dehalococcoidia bacterium]|nr:hypothetical protein [Dehalococcoidia bacterium]